MNQFNNISPEEFEQIEVFLSNEMTHQQSLNFSSRLQSDEVLEQKVNEIKLFLIGIKEAALEEKLNDFHDGIKPHNQQLKTKSRVVSFNKKWLVAACILVISFISIWWLLSNDNQNEKLYARYYAPDPGLITAMGISEDYAFEKGMVDYKEGNHSKAIDAWNKLKNSQPNNDTLNYFLGVANLAINEKEKTKEYLSIITSNKNKAFYKDACWYLGLTLLKEGEKEKAIGWIEKSGHPKSNELINAINKK